MQLHNNTVDISYSYNIKTERKYFQVKFMWSDFICLHYNGSFSCLPEESVIAV